MTPQFQQVLDNTFARRMQKYMPSQPVYNTQHDQMFANTLQQIAHDIGSCVKNQGNPSQNDKSSEALKAFTVTPQPFSNSTKLMSTRKFISG